MLFSSKSPTLALLDFTVARVVIAFALCGLVGACKDKQKQVAHAAEDIQALALLVNKDVAEIERGLPTGAQRLAKLYDKDANSKPDVANIRSALLRIRREVPDLTIAKSTFFALTDETGIVLRNDLDPDAMAGQNILPIFPGLKTALSSETFATSHGAFPGSRTMLGPDKDWAAAYPVKRAEGNTVGLFVTGWPFRRFANHLQETLKHDISEKLLKAHDPGKLPILYVAVFDTTGVYSAPLTPAVNEKALSDANLVSKTASGPFQGTMTITDREFGCAAIRTPKLGGDTGIVILRSDI